MAALSAAGSAAGTILIAGLTSGIGQELIYEYSQVKEDVLFTESAAVPPMKAATGALYGCDTSTPAGCENLARTLSTLRIKVKLLILVLPDHIPFGDRVDTAAAPNWAAQMACYRTSCIVPTALVSGLVEAAVFIPNTSKIVFVHAEHGRTRFRTDVARGGNYGLHGSKAALNATGKMLAAQLVEHGIPIAVVHVGAVHVEMLRDGPADGVLLWHAASVESRLALPQALMYFINVFNMAQTGKWFVGLREDQCAAAGRQLPVHPLLGTPLPPQPPAAGPANQV